MSKELASWLLSQFAARRQVLQGLAKQKKSQRIDWYKATLQIEGATYQLLDEKRELTDLEARRRIVEQYVKIVAHPGFQKDPALSMRGVELLELVIKHLAVPYADQRGYKPGWKPRI